VLINIHDVHIPISAAVAAIVAAAIAATVYSLQDDQQIVEPYQ